MVGYFWLGEGKPEKALQFMEAFPSEFMEDPYVTLPKGYLVGKAYAAMGRPDAAKLEWTRALDACEKRLTGEPGNVQILAAQCVLQKLLGHEAAAQKSLDLFRQLGGESRMEGSGLLLEMGLTDGYMATLEKLWQDAMKSKGGDRRHRLAAMQWHMRREQVLHPRISFPGRFFQLANEVESGLKQLKTPDAPGP